MSTNKLVIEQGELLPESLSLIQNLEASVADGSLEVLNAVAHNREVGQFEEAPPFSTWKRAIVSPTGSNIVFKLFFPGAAQRKFFYHFIAPNPVRKAYNVAKRLPKISTRSLSFYAYGYTAKATVADCWFLALERLSSVLSYEEYALNYMRQAVEIKTAREKLCTYVANRISQAHSSGFFHKDLKAYHIYIDKFEQQAIQEPIKTSDWLWIDLDDTEILKDLPYRKRIINLYQCWRYLLEPHGLSEPDNFIHEYKAYTEASLPPENKIISDMMKYYQKQMSKKSKKVISKGKQSIPEEIYNRQILR